MKILTSAPADTTEAAAVLSVANDVDVTTLSLYNVRRIDLVFPKFTDGRAYSQAFALRRRLGYQGALRATGDVLLDQLVQMQRCGFDEALLRTDQDAAQAERLLGHFQGFYQGDAVAAHPHFVPTAAPAEVSV